MRNSSQNGGSAILLAGDFKLIVDAGMLMKVSLAV